MDGLIYIAYVELGIATFISEGWILESGWELIDHPSILIGVRGPSGVEIPHRDKIQNCH